MSQKKVITLATIIIIVSLATDLSGLLDPLHYKNESVVKAMLLGLSILSFLVIVLASVTFALKSTWSHWWKFAKYAAPLCFALIVAINFGVLHTTSYGTFGVGDMLNQAYDMWALGLVYAVFVVGSLVQIARGYFAKP